MLRYKRRKNNVSIYDQFMRGLRVIDETGTQDIRLEEDGEVRQKLKRGRPWRIKTEEEKAQKKMRKKQKRDENRDLFKIIKRGKRDLKKLSLSQVKQIIDEKNRLQKIKESYTRNPGRPVLDTTRRNQG